MKVKCAWCDKDMGEKPPFGGLDGKFDKQVTHGICQECIVEQKRNPDIFKELDNARSGKI